MLKLLGVAYLEGRLKSRSYGMQELEWVGIISDVGVISVEYDTCIIVYAIVLICHTYMYV